MKFKHLIYGLLLTLSFTVNAQTPFPTGIRFPNLTQATTADSIPVMGANGIIKSYITKADFNGFPDIEALPTTQTIELGDVGSEDIVTAFNTHTFTGDEVPVQEQNEGYVLINVIIDSVPLQYLFVGVGGEYGTTGDQTAIEDDFVLLDETVFDNSQVWVVGSSNTGVPATLNSQSIFHGGVVNVNRLIVGGGSSSSTAGIYNRGTGSLYIRGNQGINFSVANQNVGNFSFSHPTPSVTESNETKTSFLLNDSDYQQTGTNYKVHAFRIAGNIDFSNRTGDSYYSAFTINPTITGAGKYYSILSQAGDAYFDNGTFSITDIAAPTGETYMVTVDEDGLLSSDVVPSGGGTTPGLQQVLDTNGYAENGSSFVEFYQDSGELGFTHFYNGIDYTEEISSSDGITLRSTQKSTGAYVQISVSNNDLAYQKIRSTGNTIFGLEEPISETYINVPAPSLDGTYYLTHSVNSQEADTTGNIDYTTEEDTGLTLNLSDNIAGKIFNEDTPLAYADAPFVIDNLKTGGYVINYIDTTGSTDFPPLTNSAGAEILTKGDAFREDAVFKMIVSSPNGVDVEYFFVDYLNFSSGLEGYSESGLQIDSSLEAIFGYTNSSDNTAGRIVANSAELNFYGDSFNFRSSNESISIFNADQTASGSISFNHTGSSRTFLLPDDNGTFALESYVASLFPISTADTGTVISLTTSGGNVCNMASANTNTTYTTTGTVLNAYAKVLINAASQPTVTGATLRAGATFESSTNMYMVVGYNGTIVEYYFIAL